jgi:hypothetical protein
MQLLRNILVWLVLTIIVTNSFCVWAYESEIEKETEDLVPLIIQFEGQPILPYKTQMIARGSLSNAVFSYDYSLSLQHKRIKHKLTEIIPGIKIKYDYTRIFNGMAVEVPEMYLDRLYNIPGIIDIQQDEEVYLTMADSVPMINADDVWQLTNESGSAITGKDVVVSVIDTGIDYNHPDLGGGLGPGFRVIGGYDYINHDTDPMDDHFHGTHVAGTIGANGTIKGVAPDVKFLAYKVFNEVGGGTSSSMIVEAIETSCDPDGNPSTDDAADIISMSLGGSGNPDDSMSQAVDNAFDSGVVVVVAAGNSGPGNQTVKSPGCARKALTVGAFSKSSEIASFSSRGPTSILELKPNIVAPGVDIRSTMPNGGYDEKSGTSMATPHVAGVAALVIQAHRDWEYDTIRAAVINTASEIGYHVNWEGNGMVDANQSVNAEAVIMPEDLSLGMVDCRNTMFYQERELRIKSTSNFAATYDMSIKMPSYPGVSVTLNTSTIDLGAFAQEYFTLNLTIDTSQILRRLYEGKIVATSSTENITVPFFFINENLTVQAYRNPSSGRTKILVLSPMDLVSLDVVITLPDSSTQTIPMSGMGKFWNGSFTVTQNGEHRINASSTDVNGYNNSGSTTLIADLIPPDISVAADPDIVDLFTYINVTSLENVSGRWLHDDLITQLDGLESVNPEIAVDSNNNVHLVWQDWEGLLSVDILYMRYVDGVWMDKQVISHSCEDGNCFGASDPELVIDSNDFVHVIFREGVGNWKARLYYTKINGSNGTVVEPIKNITAERDFRYEDQYATDLAVDSMGRIHATGIFYIGGKFATYIFLDNNGNVLEYDDSVKTYCIAIDPFDNIHIAYLDGVDLFYYRYDNGNMMDFMKITDGQGPYYDPNMVTDSEGNVHLAYAQRVGALFYRMRYNSNSTWSGVTKVSNIGYFNGIASEDHGSVHVVSSPVHRVSYNKFNGLTSLWEPELQLNSADYHVGKPDIETDSLFNIYVVWYDYRHDTHGNPHIGINEELYWAIYESTPYIRITQPDGSNITLPMIQTDSEGKTHSYKFYPTQDGLHYVNATARDLAGNYGYAECTFIAFVPPAVSHPKPAEGAFTTDTTPEISASLYDYSGVDVSTVIMYVNGVNVTLDATITPTSVVYIPASPLPYGPVNVSIICADNYGNAMKAPYYWEFTIIPEPPSPTDLKVVVTEDDLVLTWKAPNFQDIHHYLIYRGFSESDIDFATPYHSTEFDFDPLSTTFIDPDAANDWRTVYYAVRVVDINNKSDSNENKVWNGDWVVLNTQFHSDNDVVVNGNITVRDAGKLTISNFKIRMNSNATRYLGIKVQGDWDVDSTFNITNGSEISSFSSYGYDLYTGIFSCFNVWDSTIKDGKDFDFNCWKSPSGIFRSTVENFEWFYISGDNIVIDKSTIRNIETVRIQRSPTITNNSIYDCRYIYIMISGSEPFIAHNDFSNNQFIRVLYGSAPHFYNNTISSSDWYGISADESYPIIEKTTFINNPSAIELDSNSSVSLINSTIIGGDKHIVLDKNSHLVSLNSTFDRAKIVFDDDLSTLTILWFMHVFVRDLMGDPISGAQVIIENVTNSVDHTGATGLDGYIRWIVCTECIMNKAETVLHTPHNASATKNLLVGFADPEPLMDTSKVVEIILGTDLAPAPPSDFKIEIIGDDIRLSWMQSLATDVDHYLIYRADSPQNIDFTNPWMNTSVDPDPVDGLVIPLRLSWNDTLVASDPNNYFYAVRAVDGVGQNDSNTLILGKFVIPVVEGWNMVSIPLIQEDNSISAVFNSISGSYDMVMHYNATDGKWHSSASGLSHIDRTMGLYIHLTETTNLVVLGEAPTKTNIHLRAGWNLIGYPSFHEKSVTDALFPIVGSYDNVQVYNGQASSDPWKHWRITKPQEYNDLDLLKPGYGYWLYLIEDCTLTFED